MEFALILAADFLTPVLRWSEPMYVLKVPQGRPYCPYVGQTNHDRCSHVSARQKFFPFFFFPRVPFSILFLSIGVQLLCNLGTYINCYTYNKIKIKNKK